MQNEVVAYIAGFFDGEGSVGIKVEKRKRPCYSPYATVSQVRPEVLFWIRSIFGGSIRFNAKCGKNGIWTLWLSSRMALEMMRSLRPYLRVKGAEVDLILEAFSKKTINRKAGVPEEVQELRRNNRAKVIALRRG